MLLEHHRQCCFVDLREKAPLLTRDSTIAEYELSCDVDESPLTYKQVNRIFGTNFSEPQMKVLVKPFRKKTLGELCEAIASKAKLPRIERITVFGATSESAGTFADRNRCESSPNSLYAAK